MKESQQKWI